MGSRGQEERCWPPTMSEAKRANSEKGSKSEKFTKLKEVLCGELGQEEQFKRMSNRLLENSAL